jgi:CheY-like chemotaxis protein/signal transduction histidine kinase
MAFDVLLKVSALHAGLKDRQLWTTGTGVIALTLLLLVISLAIGHVSTKSEWFSVIGCMFAPSFCWGVVSFAGLVVGSRTKFVLAASRVFLITLLFGHACFVLPVLAARATNIAFISTVHVDLIIVAAVSVLTLSSREAILWNASALLWAILVPVLMIADGIELALPIVIHQCVLIITSVSLRKRYVQLEIQVAGLREQSQVLIRAKAQFMTAMSHEIRTPLNGLVGLTDTLRETWPLNEGQGQCVEGIQSCARVVLSMSTRALQYTRYSAMHSESAGGTLPPDAGRSRVFSLRAVLDDAARAVASAAAVRQVSMHWSVAPDVADAYQGNSQHVIELALKVLDFSLSRVDDNTGCIVMRVQTAPSLLLEDCIGRVPLALSVYDNGPFLLSQRSMPRSGGDASHLLATGADFELATADVVAQWLGGRLDLCRAESDGRPGPGHLAMLLAATIRLVSAPLAACESVGPQPASPALGFPRMSSTMSSPRCQFEQQLSGVQIAVVCDFVESVSAFRDTLLAGGATISCELVLPPPPVTEKHRQLLSQLLSGESVLRFDCVIIDAAVDLLRELLPLVCATISTALHTAVLLCVPPARLVEFEREIERLTGAADSPPRFSFVTVVTSPASPPTMLRRLHSARQRVLAASSLSALVQPSEPWILTAVPSLSIVPPVSDNLTFEAYGSQPCHGFGSLALEPLGVPGSAGRSSVASALSAPVSDATVASDTERSALPSLQLASDQRVLVVDDNHLNVMVLCRLLRKLGIESDVANNGEEALQRLRQRSTVERPGTSYAVVLMDLHMPVIDGLEATRQLRQFEQEHGLVRTPVVAVTASVADECEQACTAAGMDRFLSKPVSLRALHRALTELKL